MKTKLVVLSALILLLISFGSLSLGSGVQFSTSFNSTSIDVTDEVGDIFLVIEDTKMDTRYIDSSKPVSLHVKVTNPESSETINRNYNYTVPNDGEIDLGRTIVLHEFNRADFPSGQTTDLEIEFVANHPSFNEQVRTNTVSIVRDIDRTSCETIKQTKSDATSGVYTIDPDGTGGVSEFDVYCDMSENGGGWIRLRLDNDVDKNSDNMLWFSKYDTVAIQSGAHGSIGQQFDWSQLNQLSSESQLNSDFSDDGTTYYPEMENSVTRSNRKINYEMAGGTGVDYTDAQVEAIRQHITEVSSTTRMFTHTNDDDSCDPNGEIYTRLSNGGARYHMTPYTSGNQVSSSKYWDESDFSNTAYLIPSYIDYGDYDTSGCSGSIDHMSWGWEKDYVLVK